MKFAQGKALQTESAQRQFQNGAWGPSHQGSMSVAPAGMGLVIVGHGLKAGHYAAFAFAVAANCELPNSFKFVKELNGTTKSRLHAAIATTNDGNNIVGYVGTDGKSHVCDYDEAATVTDRPFAPYVVTGSHHAGGNAILPVGEYFLLVEDLDNQDVELALGHRGSNKPNG